MELLLAAHQHVVQGLAGGLAELVVGLLHLGGAEGQSQRHGGHADDAERRGRAYRMVM